MEAVAVITLNLILFKFMQNIKVQSYIVWVNFLLIFIIKQFSVLFNIGFWHFKVNVWYFRRIYCKLTFSSFHNPYPMTESATIQFFFVLKIGRYTCNSENIRRFIYIWDFYYKFFLFPIFNIYNYICEFIPWKFWTEWCLFQDPIHKSIGLID